MLQISCKNLTVGNNGKVACANLNFDVEAGDYLCIIGTNGSGKSTLLKTILGILKPISGSLSFGEGLEHGAIGYLPQHTDAQNDFPASVAEIVRSGFLGKKKLHSLYTQEEKDTVQHYLDLLGIGDFSQRSFSRLSGGQQQRVLLARALCAGAKILVLDEPVSGLDPVATKEMYDTVEFLNKKQHITVIMVSHDMEAVEKYATKVLRIGEEVTE